MATDKDRFIKELLAGHAPVPPLPLPGRRVAGWYLASFAFTAGVLWLVQPFRPGFLTQLIGHPRLLVETACGLWVAVATAYLAFLGTVPGERLGPRAKASILAAVGLFLTSWAWGLATAAPDFGTAGARPGCWIESLLYGGVSLVFLQRMLRRGFPRFSWRASALVGLATGFLPATLMHIACMYNPLHALEYHYGPILGLVILATALDAVARTLGHHSA